MVDRRWKAGAGALSRAAVASVAFMLAAPATADGLDRWSALIEEASGRFGVPAAWIRRVMDAESGGRTSLNGRPIASHAGAMGIMQLMPGTWAEMRRVHGLGPDPHEPRDNILAGTAYLKAMYDRFGYPGLFAAYNAGPSRYARHLSTGEALPAETAAYLRKVSAGDRTSAGVAGPPGLRSFAPPAIFAVREKAPPQPYVRTVPPAGEGLFAIRRGPVSAEP